MAVSNEGLVPTVYSLGLMDVLIKGLKYELVCYSRSLDCAGSYTLCVSESLAPLMRRTGQTWVGSRMLVSSGQNRVRMQLLLLPVNTGRPRALRGVGVVGEELPRSEVMMGSDGVGSSTEVHWQRTARRFTCPVGVYLDGWCVRAAATPSLLCRVRLHIRKEDCCCCCWTHAITVAMVDRAAV